MKNLNPKIILLLSFVIIFCFTQTKIYSQQITIGVKGGLSIPELKGGGTPQSEGYSSRLAPNFGAYINYELNNYWSLQSEILFSGQGGKRNGLQPIDNLPDIPVPPNTTLYANFDNETIINYLEIPVLISYTFNGSNSGLSEYIDAGPYLGVLLNAKTKTSGNSKIYLDKDGSIPLTINGYELPEQNFDSETSTTSDIKSINIGISGGIGINLNLGSGQLNLDLRGVYGFIPIQSDDANGSNNTGALYLTIGYGFKI